MIRTPSPGRAGIWDAQTGPISLELVKPALLIRTARAEEARVVALGLIVRAEEGACGKDIVASRAVLVTHCGPKQVRAIERKICAR